MRYYKCVSSSIFTRCKKWNYTLISCGYNCSYHIYCGVRIIGKVYTLNGVEKATIIYTNAGNLIIPLVQALLGKEWVVYTTGYILVTTVFIWTHGRMLICEEKGFNVKDLLKNVNVIASVIGILLFALKIQLPFLITETMDSMSATIAPICMIVAGMLIAGMNVKDCLKNKRLYVITFLKMIVFPLFAVALFKFTNLSSMAKNGDMILLISLLASVAPTAASVTQIAQIYDADSEYASAYYFITTMLCILTMPFFVWLYQF